MMRFFKNAHISAVAVLLGVSLVVTQSAFKAPKPSFAHEQFGKLSTGWVKISTIDQEENEIGCDLNDQVPICTGYFDTSVNPNPALTDAPLTSEPIERGTFYVVPRN
ncbi:hypothetical protein [Pedobacter sp. BMA]|uniref:hypothetical protein n=1 Tax=Pedobacter sp. BMA TaxID=1663685 RepID=UPI00064A9E6B|nr:hypothetical protein [Pedobacter sp. BMA]KLT64730.1 hypothetical protein AB669_13350 [Pedobacter sp. BMA]